MSILLEYVGSVVWIQAFLAFLGLVVIIERVLYFQHAHTKTTDLLLGIAAHARQRSYAEAAHEVARARGPISRVLHAILLRPNLPRQDLREIAQEAGQLEVPRMERNLRGLLAVALLAPLIGLFGTVLGLIEVFLHLSDNDTLNSAQALSGGMFRALLSTALGLSIAIPAYLFYLYLSARAQRLAHRIERAAIETIHIICDAREPDAPHSKHSSPPAEPDPTP